MPSSPPLFLPYLRDRAVELLSSLTLCLMIATTTMPTNTSRTSYSCSGFIIYSTLLAVHLIDGARLRCAVPAKQKRLGSCTREMKCEHADVDHSISHCCRGVCS